MQPLQWEHRPDGLRAPALVCAFKGWNDAADAASSAISFVGTALGARRFATIDPEEFYDFQATRPRVKLVDGQAREIVWPAVELFEARVPRAPRDLILLAGSEPSFRWRTFCKLIVELAEALGTQLVVTLGALLADVPHTRPVSVTGLTSDPALIARLGLTASSYEGPTGIVGILHAACQQAGLPSASLWARPTWRMGRPTTSARSTSRFRAIPTCRRSWSVSSRRPVATPTTSRASCPPAKRSPGTSSAFSVSAATAPRRPAPRNRPAAPAGARRPPTTTALRRRERRLTLGGRAHDSIVAERAGRE